MGKRKWISRSVGRFIYLKYLTNIVSQANGGIEQAVLDAYCWMYSTWNIPQVSMKFTNWRVGRKRLIILKVDFQEYKGACTGGDQVLDNMLNQGQSGTDSQVSKIFLKKTHFFKFEINTGKDIDFSFINCSRSVLFCICGGDCVVLFVRKLFVQNGLCGNRPFCYNLFDTRDLWRPLYNL